MSLLAVYLIVYFHKLKLVSLSSLVLQYTVYLQYKIKLKDKLVVYSKFTSLKFKGYLESIVL